MFVPVILSGGSGTRLWPLSRKSHPKQFIDLLAGDTLFQETIKRLPKNSLDPIIVCNEQHRFLAAEQLRELGIDSTNIILEPEGRNTAPAITIAALRALKLHDDPIILVLSADHIISNKEGFKQSLQEAIKKAEEDKLVVFGVKPSRPETGYGYIHYGASLDSKKTFNVEKFVEKPSLDLAVKYLSSGKYFWNSGIFMFKASKIISEIKKFHPEIYKNCLASCSEEIHDLDFIRLDSRNFLKNPNISIDYAVMERTVDAVVVELNSQWNDVGSWSGFWDALDKDKNNNILIGDILTRSVNRSLIRNSSKRTICVNNIEDIVIIDTPDALLVSSMESSQEVKEIVEILKNDGDERVNNHQKEYRPWGYFDSIDSGSGYKVKKIFVKPGSKLSLQKHSKRAEHWVVIKGIARVTCGKTEFDLRENESTFIPKGKLHRLENCTNDDLEIIEIQTGDYLGEDDIIRIEDDYDRHK